MWNLTFWGSIYFYWVFVNIKRKHASSLYSQILQSSAFNSLPKFALKFQDKSHNVNGTLLIFGFTWRSGWSKAIYSLRLAKQNGILAILASALQGWIQMPLGNQIYKNNSVCDMGSVGLSTLDKNMASKSWEILHPWKILDIQWNLFQKLS